MITTTAYRVVYDAAQLRFPAWPVASVGLAVALAGVGLGAYLRRRRVTSAAARTVVTSAIIFGVSWSLLVGGGLYAQHDVGPAARKRLTAGIALGPAFIAGRHR